MAEAFLNAFGGDKYLAESAGIEPGNLNPVVVEAMKELGFDLSKNRTKSVYDPSIGDKSYDMVVTVCDETSAERCPIFPGITQRLHWSFADPAALQGTNEDKLAAARRIRDEIRQAILTFINGTKG